jgi:N-acylneuraminate cytidylyltransferase
MSEVKTLFIIPARGGSKGIPGKNIKLLAGKPLICYAIDNARAFAKDCDICVTTDSEDIRRVVENYGLAVPFMRPAELASDTAGTYEVLLHAIDFYHKKGIDYDRIVLLQPTSPLCRPADVKGAMALWSDDVDMVVSVKEASTNPYYNAYELDETGVLKISKGDGHYTRRQDAPKVWEYNGAVYVITVSSLILMPMSKFGRRVPYVMEAKRSVDLDTPLDWLVAETIIKTIE